MASISKHSPPICALGLKSQCLEPPSSLFFSLRPPSSLTYFPHSTPLFLLPFYHPPPSPSFSSSAFLSSIYPPYGCFSQLQLCSRGRDETISLPPPFFYLLFCETETTRTGSECQALGWEQSAAQTKEEATNMTHAVCIAEEYQQILFFPLAEQSQQHKEDICCLRSCC